MKTAKNGIAAFFKYLLISVVALIMVFPFFWVVSCAFRPSNQLLSSPPTLLPKVLSFYSFKHVLFETNIPRFFMNSVIISATAAVLCIIIALPASYSFARHKYRGKNYFLVIILICNMVPQASTLVPLYRSINSLGLLDKHLTVSFTHLLCMLPFSIIMLRGFISTLPKSLEEAATIDGCGKLGVLARIILAQS
jgi:ABC-type glycerol-3-phosphate transport system permease component